MEPSRSSKFALRLLEIEIEVVYLGGTKPTALPWRFRLCEARNTGGAVIAMNAIISLTTIPSRIEYIEPCIDSLLAHGLPVYLWIQEEVKRTGAVLGEIPSFLHDKPHLTVAVVPERGPITKLLPAFEAGFETVITADDDLIYGKGWATGLVGAHSLDPDAVLSYRGRILVKGQPYNQSQVVKNTVQDVNFVTGVQGALYRREFFDDSIFSEWEDWQMNDDIVISAHLKRRGIRITVVPFPPGCKVAGFGKVSKIDALNTVNVKGQLNDKGLAKVYW